MRTVLCNGCFDIIHIGHKRHLEMARSFGDRLIVALTGDAFVNKGPGRPVFNQDYRTEMLLAFRFVDEVIISDEPIPLRVIKQVRPDVYAKGIEYKDRLPEQQLVEELGGKVMFTDTVVFSSTSLLGWL